MKLKFYDEAYRKNLDILYGMLGFCNEALFDSVKEFIPTTLRIIEPPDSQQRQCNCHGYTFNKNSWFEVKNVYDAIRDGKLTETHSPEEGSIIIYYIEGSSNPIIKHSGIYLGEGKVKSKWANGPVFIHDVYNTPHSYGNEIKFFIKVSDDI